MSEPVVESVVPPRAETVKGELKPWGRLETESIVLERPDELLRNVAGYYQAYPWVFPNTARQQFLEVLAEASISDAERRWLGSATNWHAMADGP